MDLKKNFLCGFIQNKDDNPLRFYPMDTVHNRRVGWALINLCCLIISEEKYTLYDSITGINIYILNKTFCLFLVHCG